MDYFNTNWGWYDTPIDTGYRTYSPATKDELKRLQYLVTGNFNTLVDEFNSNVDQLSDVKSAADAAVSNATNVINSANSAITVFNSDYATPSSIESVASNALANAIYAYSNATSAASVANSASNNISVYNEVISGYGSVIANNTKDANNATSNANSALSLATQMNNSYSAATSAINLFNSNYSNNDSNYSSFTSSLDDKLSVAQTAFTTYSDNMEQFQQSAISQTSMVINTMVSGLTGGFSSQLSMLSDVANVSSLASQYTAASSYANSLSQFSDVANSLSQYNSTISNFNASYTSLQNGFSSANDTNSNALTLIDSLTSKATSQWSLFNDNIKQNSAYINSKRDQVSNMSVIFSWSYASLMSNANNFSSYATQISNDAVSISGFASAANDAYNNAQANNSLATQANSNANSALALAQSAQANAGGANSAAFDARTIAEKASSDASLASSAELVDSSNIAVNSASIAYNDLNRQTISDMWNKPTSYAYNIVLPGVKSTVQLQRASGGRYNLIINPGSNETMETNGIAAYSGTSGDSLTTAGSVVNKPTQLSTSVGYSYVTTVDLSILVHIGTTDKAYKVTGITPGNQTYSSFNNQPVENAYFTVQRLN